jgi:hypothetical protein
MSSVQASQASRAMHVVDIQVGAGIRRGVTAGNQQVPQILAALGISEREPLQAQSLAKMAISDKLKNRCLIFNDLQS